MMYKLDYKSEAVKKKLKKELIKMRSNPKKHQDALAAINSLKENPRKTEPGDKHRLVGDRIGSWSLRLTKNMRLVYVIDDQELTVTAWDVVDYH